MGSSKADLKAFPAAVMDDMGHQLFLVQCGLEPDDWKPVTTVGTGVKEVRVKDGAGIFRAVYLATRPEAVYVPHCFQKKTQQTAQRDIELARKRFNYLAHHPDNGMYGCRLIQRLRNIKRLCQRVLLRMFFYMRRIWSIWRVLMTQCLRNQLRH